MEPFRPLLEKTYGDTARRTIRVLAELGKREAIQGWCFLGLRYLAIMFPVGKKKKSIMGRVYDKGKRDLLRYT